MYVEVIVVGILVLNFIVGLELDQSATSDEGGSGPLLKLRRWCLYCRISLGTVYICKVQLQQKFSPLRRCPSARVTTSRSN